ncbi:MAG: hypothetical protein GX173_07840 [Ruminococcaceae bacterium]|jgi:uncharacterized protein YpmB|nr:hypothetical protein [Oscillospiraceae bacterium]
MKKILILIIAVITVSVLLVSSTVFASSSTMPSNVSESGEEGPPWAASRGKKQDV